LKLVEVTLTVLVTALFTPRENGVGYEKVMPAVGLKEPVDKVTVPAYPPKL
jgi:hypothetical protein